MFLFRYSKYNIWYQSQRLYLALYSLVVLRDFLPIWLFHIACYYLGFIYPTLHVFYLEIKIRINMFELRFFKHINVLR